MAPALGRRPAACLDGAMLTFQVLPPIERQRIFDRLAVLLLIFGPDWGRVTYPLGPDASLCQFAV